MHPKHLLLTSLLLYLFYTANAQVAHKPTPKCGSEFILNDVLSDPIRAKKYLANEQMIAKRISNKQSGIDAALALGQTSEVKIPVVFHIVDPNPNSITDEMINLQLAILNRDYSGKNPDSVNATAFYGVRGHSKITFVLAKRSPRGCDTTGIVRVTSNLTVHGVLKDNNGNVTASSNTYLMKYTASGGDDGWDSYNCHYLNIWVCNLTNGLLGEGTFPENVPSSIQGLVIEKSTFSFTVPSQYAFGRTLVHEVGHFLNLMHIWGDDDGQANKCIWDDEIGDTPKQALPTFGAPAGIKYDVCSPAPGNGINYQNFMDYCDDIALTMFTNQQIVRILAGLEVLPNRRCLIDKNNKALTPAESNELFNMCNTPDFTTNAFTTIAVGKGGVVWAGSANSGLYQYRGGRWHRNVNNVNNNYQDVKADKYGGIWVAQSGYGSAQANTGGIFYIPDTLFPAITNYYSFSNGLPSRYAKGLFIDTSKTYQPGLDTPLIYTANFAHITAGVTAAGGVGRGFKPVAPNYFTTFRKGMQTARVADGTASIYCIAGDYKVIWAHTQNNYGSSQILRYKNNILMDTLQSLDTTNIFNDFLPGQFNAKAMYFDARGNRWITINGRGIIVTDSTETVWSMIDFAALFPSTPAFNTNAISGDTSGNVYFGTQNGLIVYSGNKTLDDVKSYKLYTTANGLPSNNIKAIAADTMRQKLLIATDAGIVFWNPSCASGPAVDNINVSTVATGAWNNPAIWCNGVVPPANARIIVRHPVTITANTHCMSLQLVLPGSFTVSPGIDLIVGN